MKLVKGLLLTLVVTGILAATGVSAEMSGYMGYSDIILASFSGVYSDGDYTKTTSNKQTLHTIDARDAIIYSNTRAVQARTKQMLTPTSTTSWIDAVIGGTVDWGNQNTGIGSYRLQLRAKKSTVAQTRYWGTWIY